MECGRSRGTAKRSDLAGWAEYGYCASHSRYFWGLRPHLVCTLHGLPVAFALTGAKADGREALLAMFTAEAVLAAAGLRLLRPARQGEPTGRHPVLQAAAPGHRVGQRYLQGPARSRTPRRPHPGGVTVRVLQRLLALTAAIWHNDTTGQPVMRSLIAYDR